MKAERDDDRRLKPGHQFRDPGEPIIENDYKPRSICGDPEQTLAAAFVREGQDYGGKLPANF